MSKRTIKRTILSFIAGMVVGATCIGLWRLFLEVRRNYTVDIRHIQGSCGVCTTKNSKQYKYIFDSRTEHVLLEVPLARGSSQTIYRKGLLMLRPEARATIVISHGFMCDKNDMNVLRTLFADYNVMIFDFRAHGENAVGQCCSFGTNEALEVAQAVAFVKSKKELATLPVIAYGFSMGAVATILAQAHDSSLFTATILDAPFDSTEMVINRLVEKLTITIGGYSFGLPGRSLLKKYAYSPVVQKLLKTALKSIAQTQSPDIVTCMQPAHPALEIQKVTIPCLIISCKNDDKAPVNAVKEVYANAAGFKRLWLTDGRNHCDSLFYNPEKYMYKVHKFVTDVLDNNIEGKELAKIIEDGMEAKDNGDLL